MAINWGTWGPSIVSAASSLFGGERANRFARDLSGTAHQREVEDLRRAGLNPILSGTGGAGASTPSQEDTITPAINSAMSAKRMQEELKNLVAQRELIRSQTAKTDWDREVARNAAQIGDVQLQFAPFSAAQSLRNQEIQNSIAEKSMPLAELQLEGWKLGGKALADLLEKLGVNADQLRTLRGLGSSLGVGR